jgi:hypothetical protein
MKSRHCLLCHRELPSYWGSKRCGFCNSKWTSIQSRVSGQSAAGLTVNRAIKDGKLPAASNMKCVDCGNPAQVYDHRDYAKPLEIEPVCKSCNRKRGSAIWIGQKTRFTKPETAYLYHVLSTVWRGPQLGAAA